MRVSRALVKLGAITGAVFGGLTVMLAFVIGFYALGPWVYLCKLLPERVVSPRPELALFQRDGASIQVRSRVDRTYQPVVIRPLSPLFNFRTALPPDQPDSTWAAASIADTAAYYQKDDFRTKQQYLLAEAADYRREAAKWAQQEVAVAAERQRLAARVFNTLHFELDTEPDSLSGARDCRSERLPLPDSVSDPSLSARLTPDRVMWIRTTMLTPYGEVFSIALVGFRGVGHYRLGAPPLPTARRLTGPGYVELLRYGRVGRVTATSSNTSPVQVRITQYDPKNRLVAGTFEGEVQDENGQTTSIEDGEFEVRYQ